MNIFYIFKQIWHKAVCSEKCDESVFLLGLQLRNETPRSHSQPTLGGDPGDALLGAGVVGGRHRVGAAVVGTHVMDSELVGAVGRVVAVHAHALVLNDLHSVFVAKGEEIKLLKNKLIEKRR